RSARARRAATGERFGKRIPQGLGQDAQSGAAAEEYALWLLRTDLLRARQSVWNARTGYFTHARDAGAKCSRVVGRPAPVRSVESREAQRRCTRWRVFFRAQPGGGISRRGYGNGVRLAQSYQAGHARRSRPDDARTSG